MVEVLLFGKLIHKAQKKETGKGTTIITLEKELTIKELIQKLSINPEEVGDMFLDFKPATVNDKINPENKRLAVFPKENHFPWINIY